MLLNMHLNEWEQIVFALNNQRKLDMSHPLKCVSHIFAVFMFELVSGQTWNPSRNHWGFLLGLDQ